MKTKLRAIELSDLGLLYNWENDTDNWMVSNTLLPFSRYTLEQYILSAQSLDIYTSKQLRLMIDIEEKNTVKTIGIIDLFDFDPTHLRAGIGILIDKKYRNNGFAFAALQEFILYSFTILQLHQLYCNITSDNEISLKLFKSAGFIQTGLKKEWLKATNTWVDECFLQLIKR